MLWRAISFNMFSKNLTLESKNLILISTCFHFISLFIPYIYIWKSIIWCNFDYNLFKSTESILSVIMFSFNLFILYISRNILIMHPWRIAKDIIISSRRTKKHNLWIPKEFNKISSWRTNKFNLWHYKRMSD
jgi:hypothetical protein